MEKKINKNLIAWISSASVALIGFMLIAILVMCDYNFKIDKFNIAVANNRNSFWTGFFKIFTHLGSFYTLAALAIVGIITAALCMIAVIAWAIIHSSYASEAEDNRLWRMKHL